MEELSAPRANEQLYNSWGEQPSIARPLMQGDVFENIVLPGLGDRPQLAMITMHPCNMRQGAKLRRLITVVAVQPHNVRQSDWQGRFRIMPLPELHGEGTAGHLGNFLEVASVPSAALAPTKRVSALSNEGVLILQQRLVFTETRLNVKLEEIHLQLAPTFVELELQEDWAEEALAAAEGSDVAPEAAVTASADDFQSWLDENDKARREALKSTWEHSRLRREAREACQERYSTQ